MKKPKKTGRLDFAQLAKAVVDAATDEAPPVDDGKDKAKVAAGRKGGEVGGDMRAQKLTPTQRSASAKMAATARWANKKKQDS
jgi:hypothetical protein